MTMIVAKPQPLMSTLFDLHIGEVTLLIVYLQHSEACLTRPHGFDQKLHLSVTLLFYPLQTTTLGSRFCMDNFALWFDCVTR